VETYGTVFDNQPSVQIVLMEQAGEQLSEDIQHNKQLEKRDFHLPGSDPKGTPIQISIGMGNDGLLTVAAKHPAVEELTFSAASKDGVISKEQVAESAAKVQEMQRT
jgi:NAD(P)H-hydrate repair Nnr-like enzyme with NAD(P)H-hydrate epimerase domain